MSPAAALAATLGVLATLLLELWFVVDRRHAETASGHATASRGRPPRQPTRAHHGDVFDRPAEALDVPHPDDG